MIIRKTINKQNIMHDLFVIRQLAKRDRRASHSSALLGQLWQIFDPFITMLIFVLIFSEMFGSRVFNNYPIYILTGTIIFKLFTEGTLSCLTALSGNRSFLIKTSIPKHLYVFERVYVNFINFLFSAGIYVVFFYITGEHLKPTAILIVPNIIIFLIMIIGIGKILAVINVVFADIRYFYKIFTLIVFYGSALFYDPSRLSPIAQRILALNPVYLSIAISRISIMDGRIPKWTLWFKLAVYAFGFYVIGTYVFNKGSEDVVAKL